MRAAAGERRFRRRGGRSDACGAGAHGAERRRRERARARDGRRPGGRRQRRRGVQRTPCSQRSTSCPAVAWHDVVQHPLASRPSRLERSAGPAGATIIAHEKTRLRLSTGYYVPAEDRYEKPLPEAARPTQTFYTNDATKVGDARIEYGYLHRSAYRRRHLCGFPGLERHCRRRRRRAAARSRARLVWRRMARRARRCARAVARASATRTRGSFRATGRSSAAQRYKKSTT